MAKISIGSVLAALPALLSGGRQLLDEIKGVFADEPDDQETLQEAIRDLEAENDEGRARYRAKLKAIAGRNA